MPRRLLLVSHRSLEQAGGASARWRSMRRHLEPLGWAVDVVHAADSVGSVEFAATPDQLQQTTRRAQVTGLVGRVIDRPYAAAGLRPEAFPLSMLWTPGGALRIRRAVRDTRPDAVLASGPPHAALLAARAALGPRPAVPLVAELRDLWAGNPAFDRGGPVLPALERWVFGAARRVVVMSPEAAADVAARHPRLGAPVAVIPNGFEPGLLDRRVPRAPGPPPWTLLHSGAISIDRPLAPVLRALRRAAGRWRVVLHGYLAPEARRVLAEFPDVDVEVVPPSPWEEAVARMAAADATLITQARGAGDATAIASKVFEYLALGRPVLSVTDGGATEALLRRLGAGAFTARLDDDASIDAALARLDPAAAPVPAATLAPYSRAAEAAQTAELLEALVRR